MTANLHGVSGSDRHHRVVIVGGGAGGLELAARLGRRFGPDHVWLVDRDDSHIWKPSLHEVAAGTLDVHREGLSYHMLARDRGFRFVHGEVHAIDREARMLSLKPVHAADGHRMLDARELAYDSLVVAVGSQSHFFSTPGAQDHAIALDSTAQAERFHQQLLREWSELTRLSAEAAAADHVLRIGIVGGGATGVELAAELLEAFDSMSFYGGEVIDPAQAVSISLLEGSERILAALPERLSVAAHRLLLERGVHVHTSVKVARVDPDALYDQDGNRYPVTLCVWAAGIRAPDFLAHWGLAVNGINQLIVNEYLETADPAIWAMGDCAQAPWHRQEGFLPARAQVAHQQASYLAAVLAARIRDRTVARRPFVFKDYGSLVSVGHSRGVGTLMGVLAGRGWFVEGLLARLMYMSLHLMHHQAVLGFWRTVSVALGRLLLKRSTPRVKLH